jgi:hypothetical protein
MQGDVLGSLVELLALGDEVGLAAQLDEHTEDRTVVLTWM